MTPSTQFGTSSAKRGNDVSPQKDSGVKALKMALSGKTDILPPMALAKQIGSRPKGQSKMAGFKAKTRQNVLGER